MGKMLFGSHSFFCCRTWICHCAAMLPVHFHNSSMVSLQCWPGGPGCSLAPGRHPLPGLLLPGHPAGRRRSHLRPVHRGGHQVQSPLPGQSSSTWQGVSSASSRSQSYLKQTNKQIMVKQSFSVRISLQPLIVCCGASILQLVFIKPSCVRRVRRPCRPPAWCCPPPLAPPPSSSIMSWCLPAPLEPAGLHFLRRRSVSTHQVRNLSLCLESWKSPLLIA